MSEAVREFFNAAVEALNFLEQQYVRTKNYDALLLHYRLSDAMHAAQDEISELNKSPAEQHQERLDEVLEWNR